MSKHSKRHYKARMIRAAAANHVILGEAESVEWIAGAEESGDSPKRFKMRAYTGGPMLVGYYGSPVVIDLSGLTAKAPLPILMNHSMDKVVGHADEVVVGATTLDLAGIVSGASGEADQVLASSKKGFPWKASVGARPDKMEFVGEGVQTKVNGKTFTGPLYVARKSTLGEVSFVAMSADSKTFTKVAASAAIQSGKEGDMNFDQWIQALFGGEVPELTDAQKAKLKERFDGEVKAAAAKPPIQGQAAAPGADAPTFDLSGVLKTYEKHVAAVQAKAAGYTGKIEAGKLAEIQATAGTKAAELKAKALDEEWPAARLEVELVRAQAAAEADLIRAERPKGPVIHSSTRDITPDVIQAAFSRTAGLSNLEKHFKPEVLEASDRMRGFGLQELLLHAAMQAGYDGGRTKITDGNLRAVLKAAFSTHTVTTLLTTTGNKLLLDGFNAMPQTWREVADVRTVTDFKQTTAYRLTADLEYELLPPGGKIAHGTLGQESYTVQARTYAKMLTLTRQDIINDDLGAFNDIRKRLGIGSALKINKVFWTAWLTARNAGTFWTAARTNLVTGAPLGEAGLAAAEAAFTDMKGPDGNLMSLIPDRVIVPTALGPTARKWYVSQEMRDTTASTKAPTANIYQNRFRPVVVPEMGSSSYTGYSATTWHMATDPKVLASAVMSFLNGQESPTIESADADFDELGINARGYHDFGADMSEYRATVQANA